MESDRRPAQKSRFRAISGGPLSAQAQADIANRAALRDQSIANQQSQRQEAQARINQQNLDNQRTTFTRSMEDVTKAGGFEAPTVPPSVTTYTQPADPKQPINIYNMPMSRRLFSPGLQPQQSSGLGTVQQLTDPDTGETRNMVRPSPAVQQEMQQQAWPKVTPEMAGAFGLKEGDPMPQAVFDTYQRRLQARDTQANKPPRAPIRVGNQLVDPDTYKPVYTAPDQQKQPKPAQFAAIETRKQQALARAQTNASTRLQKLKAGLTTETSDDVYGDLAAQTQQIQNAYEQEIAALTGNYPGHYEYPQPGAPAPASQPQPAAAPKQAQPAARRPGAAPQVVSESELRQSAVAKGLDPDNAVQVAKRKGFTLTK